ncbi:MAG: hypothetical protein ACNS62_12740 [Candidatus Cyclobacteriaceae bacterium M3_2C_046]
MSKNKVSPINQLFLLVFSLMMVYLVMKRIPLFEDEFFGMTYLKWLKAFMGLFFALGGLFIYIKAKYY